MTDKGPMVPVKYPPQVLELLRRYAPTPEMLQLAPNPLRRIHPPPEERMSNIDARNPDAITAFTPFWPLKEGK